MDTRADRTYQLTFSLEIGFEHMSPSATSSASAVLSDSVFTSLEEVLGLENSISVNMEADVRCTLNSCRENDRLVHVSAHIPIYIERK